MRIIIAGAGEVGTHLAKLLVHENVETTLLDEDPDRLEDLSNNYDLLIHEGSPTSIKDLKEVRVENADLFIAVTPYESVNTTACMIANNLGAKATLARIDNYEYLQPKNKQFFEQLGVNHLIYPEMLAGKEIAESLKTSWIRQYLGFCGDSLIMIACKVRSNALILNKKFKTGFFDHDKYRIVAVKRRMNTIIPSGEDEIKANDLVYFMTMPENLDFVREQAGKEDYQIKNVMFMGGGRIVRETIYQLPEHINKKILERDKEKSYALADKFSETLIINADARNVEILKEEGIKETHAFVAATSNTEANILACLVAKRFGVRKTIAEVENIDYIMLAENLDIGTVINKKFIAASYIYQITLDADVLNVHNLISVDAEVVEFMVKEKAKVTRSKVKDLRLPEDVNIGGIVRENKAFVVNGDIQIQPGDHVVVFCPASKIRKLESFFN
ncbi:Trk system potassium transporter TrkA [Paludibacter sp. 221]|uniref:Trk system potassium transporter TrkA n=1 Tax=Paludibacter sp. 221 TaxID=2302939 RepID=UPI0013D3A999|nr:Trk system potassium transporter TrkA [Paludibacter sp. 221]NDV46173.1 Trk system potassium transporter TrkA [Paludibacter sp. 221]